MTIRIGHDLLFGKTTLRRHTVIDIVQSYGDKLLYQTINEEGNISNVDLTEAKDWFAHITNGIDKPETQNVEAKFTVEGEEGDIHFKYELGTKVKFTTEFNNAQLEVEGYVIRNFWREYYLISEVGVSIANRAWKVASSKVKLVS